jgi:cellulose synthase/poly-beta-1,6-N-acetylglucosamine synthase-like glycosyltransferase/peptidoglycan/xylan/chitin deacetylase (PgdA/CDA1 family)
VTSHRRPQHEPRAHWVLLVLGMLILLAELSLGGLVRHVGADGVGPVRQANPGAAPKAVTEGGPVIRLDGNGQAATASMPAGTIALTFDDGPDPQWTPKILDLLAKHHAHATFFVIGSQVNDHPDLVRRMVAEGHEVAVHTFTHPDLSDVPSWRRGLELSLSRNALAAATGQLSNLMRPPYSSEPDAVSGQDYDAMLDAARRGYLVVLADHDTEDWRRPGVATIVQRATPAKNAGAIVLMHDGGGDRSQTVAALDDLLTRLDNYRFTTVSAGLKLAPAGDASTMERLRGDVLRWAQQTSGWLASVMTVFLWIALVLALVRLIVQVITARIHVGWAWRRRPRRLAYLGLVSAIVPAYNESANIAATVRSLVDNDYPELEVIVVDDGSTDGTADVVRRLHMPEVRVISQRNAGKPAALNTGIADARGEFLVLVDGDTVFNRDAIGRLVQPFMDPSVGAVSGNTKVANRRGLLGRWQHLEYVMGFNLDRRMFEVAECVTTVPGAIGAFRRATLQDVGGVAAVTLAEDTDLTMSVLQAGWRVVYEESAVAWTEVPSTMRQLWRQRYRWCFGTMQAMWVHRSAVTATGPAGKLGRRGLAYLLCFQILLPLCAPAVDVFAVYGLAFLPWHQVAAAWLGFTALQVITAAYALHLDRESLQPLWTVPLQQFVYRQLMYLVVVQSTVTALTGIRLRWHRIARTGAAHDMLETR